MKGCHLNPQSCLTVLWLIWSLRRVDKCNLCIVDLYTGTGEVFFIREERYW